MKDMQWVQFLGTPAPQPHKQTAKQYQNDTVLRENTI